jgi:hypothetical protein
MTALAIKDTDVGTASPRQDTELDQLCINTIRTLAMDAVQQAKSGHPGTPMALAPLAGGPMRMWPISTRGNKPENDYPSIVEPIELSAVPSSSRPTLGAARSLPPEVLKPRRRQFGVPDRMLDVAIAEIGLQSPGIALYWQAHVYAPAPGRKHRM